MTAQDQLRDTAGCPTQVQYPRRASWRTFLQALLGFLPLVNGVLALVQELLAQAPYNVLLPGWIYAIVNAGVLLGAFVSKLIAQLMANPIVNRWIECHAGRLAAAPCESQDVDRIRQPAPTSAP